MTKWKAKQPESEMGQKDLLRRLRDETDRLFDAFLREPLGNWEWPFRGEGWSPVVDLAEDDEELIIRSELPGLDPDQIDLSLSETEMVLSGEKRLAPDLASKSFHQVESRQGAFRRAIPLPRGLDLENVAAEHAHGVLTVRIKKSRKTEPKKIAVKVGGPQPTA